MFVIGVCFQSPHRVVEALLSKYRLHLCRSPIQTYNQASSDKVTARLAVKEFLLSADKNPRILLVESMRALFSVRKLFKSERNSKRLRGIIIFDDPLVLQRYGIKVVDAVLGTNGVWLPRRNLSLTSLTRMIGSSAIANTTVAMDKLKSKNKASPSDYNSTGHEVLSSNKVRGFIGSFISEVKLKVTDGKDRKLIRSTLGYILGIESKPSFEESVEILTTKYGLSPKILSGLRKYARSKPGKHLVCTFYLTQRGKSFASAQRQYKSLHMDDWLMLQESVPSTSKYRFIRKPDRI